MLDFTWLRRVLRCVAMLSFSSFDLNDLQSLAVLCITLLSLALLFSAMPGYALMWVAVFR